MELAWQKERESQKKLINELNTMARDLKATLLEVEKERDRERLDAKRKLQVKNLELEIVTKVWEPSFSFNVNNLSKY